MQLPVIEITARDTGLTPYAAASLRCVPGEADGTAAIVADALTGTADSDAGQAVLDAVADRDGPVIVVLGRESVAEHAGVTVHAASLLARVPTTRFLSALAVGNVHGALDLGLTPGFLPGRYHPRLGCL